MKICPVGGQTDGQTDVTKLIVAFRNFANASKSDGLLSSAPTQYNNNQLSVMIKAARFTKSRYSVNFIRTIFKYF